MTDSLNRVSRLVLLIPFFFVGLSAEAQLQRCVGDVDEDFDLTHNIGCTDDSDLVWYTSDNGDNVLSPSGGGAVDLTWNTEGTFKVARHFACNGGTQVQTFVVTDKPDAPLSSQLSSTASAACGSATLSYSGGVYDMYWQTSSTGTSTANRHTMTVTTVGTNYYYARIKNSNGCWSDATSRLQSVYEEPVGGYISGGGTFYGYFNGNLTLRGYTGTIKEWRYTENSGSEQVINSTSATLPVTISNYTSSNLSRTYWAVVQNQGICTTSSQIETMSLTAMPSSPTEVCSMWSGESVLRTVNTTTAGSCEAPKHVNSSGVAYSWNGDYLHMTGDGYLVVTKRRKNCADGCYDCLDVTYQDQLVEVFEVNPRPTKPSASNLDIRLNCNGDTELYNTNGGTTIYWQTTQYGASETHPNVMPISATGTYYATVKNTEGCHSEGTAFNVSSLLQALTAGSTIGGGSFYGQANVSMQLTAGGTIGNWFYSENGGSPVNIGNSGQSILPINWTNLGTSTKTRQYWAEVTRNGCTIQSDIGYVTLNGIPQTPNFTACVGDQKTYSISSSGFDCGNSSAGVEIVSVTGASGPTSTSGNNVTITWNSSGQAILKRKIPASSSNYTCNEQYYIDRYILVEVHSTPSAPILSASQLVCSSGNTEIQYSGSLNIFWQDDNSPGQSASYVVSEGITQYKARVENATGCTSSFTTLSGITPLPMPGPGSVSGSGFFHGSVNQPISWSSGSVGTLVEWERSTDNGTTWTADASMGTSSNPNVTLKNFGSTGQTTQFRAQIEANGCTVSSPVVSITMEAIAAPDASLATCDELSDPYTLAVELGHGTGTIQNAEIISNDGAAGSIFNPNQQNFSINWTAPGTAIIRRRVLDENGEYNKDVYKVFTVHPKPNPIMEDLKVDLDCATGDNRLSYTGSDPTGVYWQLVDDGVETSDNHNTRLITSDDTYYARVLENGCWSDAHTYSAVIHPLPDGGDLSANVASGSEVYGGSDLNFTLDNNVGTIESWAYRFKQGETGTWSSWETFSADPLNQTQYEVSNFEDTPKYYEFQANVRSDNCFATSTVIGVITNKFIGSIDENFISTTNPKNEVVDLAMISSDPLETQRSITYFDGLGRPKQITAIAASPNQQDIITPIVYDATGRQHIDYLPYVANMAGVFDPSAINSADYTASNQYLYYQGTPDVPQDTKPYSLKVFEASPLNRVSEQYAPGAAWHSGHPVTYDYTSNEAIDVGSFTAINDELYFTGYYAPGEVTLTVVTDENGNEVRVYTNDRGQVVLKRVQVDEAATEWAETYYVYDAFQRLRFVLQPEFFETGIENFVQGLVPNSEQYITSDLEIQSITKEKYTVAAGASLTVSSPSGVLEIDSQNGSFEITTENPEYEGNTNRDAAFEYRYDERGRMIEKKVPGVQDFTRMVYDRWDRLVLTQDANQKATDQWLFTKYDHLNRPVVTGFTTGSLATVQTDIENEPDRFESIDFASGTLEGYTNSTYPTTVDEILTVTFYDDYSFLNETGWELDNNNTIPAEALDPVKGQVTGSIVKMLTAGTLLKSVTFYDDRYRVIKTVTENHTGGVDIIQNTYDFEGQLLASTTSHSGIESHEISRNFTYDHMGRVLKVAHTIDNSATTVEVVANEYTPLGNLKTKNLHSVAGETQQSVDYQYNIRGWLTDINNVDQYTAPDLFAMRLNYNTASEFNGNIGSVSWKGAFDALQHQYTYGYDPMNRLISADFSNSDVASLANFNIESINYDLNGNILSLDRKGKLSSGLYGGLDDMGYTYDANSPNRLLGVSDAGDDEMGFKDGNSGNDYLYDANGNMMQDLNKGVTSISYNHLNLPETVILSGSEASRIEYEYDAAGTKLSQKVYDDQDQLQKTRTYAGEFIYEDDKLQLIQHEEGRIVPKRDINDIITGFEYQYHLKDHLGNVRVTFTSEPGVWEYFATMEETPIEVKDFEEFMFDNVAETRGDSRQLANVTTGGSFSAELQGEIGPGVAIAVLPEDVLDMSVSAYYETGDYSNTTAIAGLANIIGSSLAGIQGISEAGNIISSVSGELAGTSYAIASSTDATTPAAYLNYLVFDLEFNLVETGQGSGYLPVPGNDPDVNHLLSQSITITEPGFVYVYISNGSTDHIVHFDDLLITHSESPVRQVDSYYPFGLTFNSYQRFDAERNKFKYNGKEEQEEWGVLDYGARMYDPALGRWSVVDPYSEIYEYLTPYNYSLNDPISVVDPDGRLVIYVNGYPKGHSINYDHENQQFYKNDQFGYWGRFDNYMGGVLNDNNSIYHNGGFRENSTGGERYDRGYEAGKLIAQKIKSGEITLQDGETIKLIGHSHGGAHATGITDALIDAELDVEALLVFAPHQPSQFALKNKLLKSIQFSRLKDQVSSDRSEQSWLESLVLSDSPSEYSEISGFNKSYLLEDGDDDGLGNHGIGTFYESLQDLKENEPEIYKQLLQMGLKVEPDDKTNK